MDPSLCVDSSSNALLFILQYLRHEQLALVGQEPVLFSGSIEHNCTYSAGDQHAHLSAEERRQKMVEASKVANAHNFVSALPEG